VSASTTSTVRSLCAIASRRKLSRVTSKCTMPGLDPSGIGTRVELEITHSSVSGDTYGFAWYTWFLPSANDGAKNGFLASSGDRSA
jgi:hypothetical protein